jgi:23S rRNA (cytosine1962-C5)-methyltransferase
MSFVRINRKGVRRVRSGHPWVFKSDVVEIDASGGAVVSVLDEFGNFIGKAFYSDSSEISIRVFCWEDREINRDFWLARFKEAIARRGEKDETSNSRRLINGESDLIPSVVVDQYGGCLAIQTLSQGADALKEMFIGILSELVSPETVVERNDVKIRERENLPQSKGIVFGELDTPIITKRDGLLFEVDPLNGQKTGSFLDQRHNHFRSRHFAKGKALDCFTFQGGFAMNMALSSSSVEAVDISDDAISAAKRNSKLNNISNIEFIAANVFDFLRDCPERSYDCVVLDPPAFVKSKSALKSAVRGYKEINLRGLKLLKTGGNLLTYSCSHHLSEELFIETLQEAARDAKRRVQIIERHGQPFDHPILLGMPESSYLKGFVLTLLD